MFTGGKTGKSSRRKLIKHNRTFAKLYTLKSTLVWWEGKLNVWNHQKRNDTTRARALREVWRADLKDETQNFSSWTKAQTQNILVTFDTAKFVRVENNLKSPLYSHWKQATQGKLRWPSKHVRKTVILDTRKTDTCCTNVFQINLKRITKLNQNKTLETTFSFLFARFLKCGHELSHNCWL